MLQRTAAGATIDSIGGSRDGVLLLALQFAGQGSQHPRMAAGLYNTDEVFTSWMDRAFELFHDAGPRLRSVWLDPEPGPVFDDVTVSQPLLYSVSHALGQMVLSWGVRPVAMLGHSVGEMIAATLAGVIDFSDGVWLMRDRLKLFARTPPGGMLAVAASVSEVDPILGEDVFLAAVNAPRQLLLAGEDAPLDRAARQLTERGLTCRRVAAHQAFHSPIVAGAIRSSLPAWAGVTLRPPSQRLYSAYTEDLLDAAHAQDSTFWANQPGETVLFASTLDRVLSDQDVFLLESGPGASLTVLARRHRAVVRGASRNAAVLPDRCRGDQADRDAVARARDRVAEIGQSTQQP